MTSLEILQSVLLQQGKTTDAQVEHKNRDRLFNLLNEGLIDLASDLKLRTTETVDVGTDGILDLVEDLTQECTKLIGIKQNGKPVRYGRGPTTYEVRVFTTGPVEVEYRYMPARLTNDTDVPGVPDRLHPLLVNYVLGKDNTTNDVTAQQRANQFYQLYEAGKARAQRMYGEPEFYNIINKY